MKKTLRTGTCLFCLLLALLLAAAGFSGFALYARADETDKDRPYDYAPIENTSLNNQFDNSSGSFPTKSPESWGSVQMPLGGSSTDVVSGVISLNAADFAPHADKYKLNEKGFTTGAEVPKTYTKNINGSGDNDPVNVLFIHNLIETASHYVSPAITLNANSALMVSVRVKTGAFKTGGGAYIVLTDGDKFYLSHDLIDTSASTWDNGWEEYSIIVEGFTYKSVSLNLKLCVGESNAENPKSLAAAGYAMFDDIRATEINKKMYTGYANGNVSKTRLVRSFAGQVTDAIGNPELVNGGFEEDAIGYTLTSGVEFNGKAGRLTGVSNAFNESTVISKVKENPMSPDGSDTVLQLANNFTGARGATLSPLNIEMHRHYRLSVWVKTFNVTGGDNSSGAMFILTDKSYGVDEKQPSYLTDAAFRNMSGDASDTAHYGYREYVYYIKGSVDSDYTLTPELWLGEMGDRAKYSTGAAYFDCVNFELLTPSEFNANSSGGTIIELSTETNSTITNGDFNLVGDYEEYKYPLLPASWTGAAADNVTVTGVISGIVNTKNEHFDANKINYGNFSVANPMPNSPVGNNLLMIYSGTKTAYSYRSPEITVGAGETKQITVSMNTQIPSSDYGASLLLKQGSSVVAGITGKNTNGEWSSYNFYIEGGSSSKTFTLELWLGEPDGKSNTTRLSSGAVFFDYVTINDMSGSFSEIRAKYYSDIRGGDYSKPDYAIFSSNNIYFDSFEVSENDLKTPSNFTLSVKPGNSGSVKGGIFSDTSSKWPFVLMLNNSIPTYSSYTWTGSETLTASGYMKVTVRLKTLNIMSYKSQNPANDEVKSSGATVTLTGANATIKDINTETRPERMGGNNDYMEYVFYVKGGDSEVSLGVKISLGKDGSEKRTEWAQGTVYVNYIEFDNTITEDDFIAGTAILDLTDDDEDYESDKYRMAYVAKADLSAPVEDDTTPTEEGDNDNELDWWLIPTLLIAFALLLAVVGTIFKHFWSKRKKHVKKIASYDRRKTLSKVHDKNLRRLEGIKEDGGEYEETTLNDDEATTEQETEETVKEADKEPAADEGLTDETESTTDEPAEEQPKEIEIKRVESVPEGKKAIVVKVKKKKEEDYKDEFDD